MRQNRQPIPVERLFGLFTYEPATGSFRYKVRRGPKAPGDLAGSISVQGYRLLEIDGRKLRASRVAWAMMTGAWPAAMVDHISGDRSDDRWTNLRAATNAQNGWNTKGRGNKHGYKGVVAARRSFRAVIMVDGRHRWLGTYKTPIEAARAYDAAALEFFGEFARVNGA